MRDGKYEVIAINLGSTSTKLAWYENDACRADETQTHPSSQLAASETIWDQYTLRKAAVLDFVGRNGIALDEVDAIATRGGHTEPITGGTYRINDAMRAQNMSGRYGMHVGNLGMEIATELCAMSGHAVATITDLPTTDEFAPLARYSGLPSIERESRFQALNQRAMAKAYAASAGKAYEDLRLVVVMLGGGISVVAHDRGRMVDGPDALAGEGPFSNNRAGSLPTGQLVRMCYESGRTEEEMLRLLNGNGGLLSYLGETNVRTLVARAEAGDAKVAEVLDAMIYQTAKDVGAYATVLEGRVDAIVLTGGMAHSSYITERLQHRVGWIAPVATLPGEREMESLAINAYRCVSGQQEFLEFVPKHPADLRVLNRRG